MKRCSKCKRYLPLGKFHIRGEIERPRSHCKDCVNEDNLNRYYKADKKKVRKASYRYNLKVNYGLSEEDYNIMYYSQDGKCAICPEKLSNRFLNVDGVASVVDHSHTSGLNRELLCASCNTGLGSFKDNGINLKNAINYLEKHNL